MAKSYPDFIMTGSWQDIAAATGYTTIANQKVTIQQKSGFSMLVFMGGASAPGEKDGIAMTRAKAVTGTSDHFWVKGKGRAAVLVED
jgi:hypothetical protein